MVTVSRRDPVRYSVRARVGALRSRCHARRPCPRPASLDLRRVPSAFPGGRTRVRCAHRSTPDQRARPEDQQLTIDVARFGADRARRVLVVLSGVHGVEGFLTSALQADALTRWAVALPPDVGVLFVHGVNPWGMAWWRRQNESNVDLNRNWRRDDGEPFENEAYEELHALACPDTPELPSIGDLASTAQALVDARGLAWVRDGITAGQYRHPDGLHYGGARIGPGHILSRRLRSGRGDDRKSRCDDRPEGGSDRERFARRASARNVFLDITGVRYEFRSRTAAGHLPRIMGVPAW
jgi:hypothetical protein